MKKTMCLLALSSALSLPVFAQVTEKQESTMKQLITSYGEKAKADAAKASKAKDKPIAVEPFSVDNGRLMYSMKRSWEGEEQPACSGCHTDNPKNEGKHMVSKKPIKPLAPAVNPERFTDVAKVEKNFTLHCRELYERDCTPMEKGHFLTYLLSVK